MHHFVLHHRHDAGDCGVAFAAFRGHHSRLRHRSTFASCAYGGHQVWWAVDADSEDDALSLLPPFVADRATATRVRAVQIP